MSTTLNRLSFSVSKYLPNLSFEFPPIFNNPHSASYSLQNFSHKFTNSSARCNSPIKAPQKKKLPINFTFALLFHPFAKICYSITYNPELSDLVQKSFREPNETIKIGVNLLSSS